MALAADTKLGAYEILGVLGSGGMGEVYRARDPRLEREVAIKVLPPSFSSDPQRLRRFLQEAHATAALNHPNILAVHDIGALGYYAPRPILDLAGLISPEVVPIIRNPEALMQLMCQRHVRFLMVLPNQRPAAEDDPRLGSRPVFQTRAPYSPAAGGGNMMVYELHWPEQCN